MQASINNPNTSDNMSRFANAYWSPDYISGIDRLSRQLDRSLGQLHELRKLVFSYFKYYHANGEYLVDLADTAYPIDSAYRVLRGQRTASGVRTVSGANARLVPPEIDMAYVYHHFVTRTAAELRAQQELAAEIDAVVLEKLTLFIKHYEPQVRTTFERLQELFTDYKVSYDKLEAIKEQYDVLVRLSEFALEDTEKAAAEPEKVAELENIASDVEPETEIPLTGEIDLPFDFPVVIAGARFADASALASFLSTLVDAITVRKRKIPLPGYRNEIFSSEQFCEVLSKNRPRDFVPSRLNMEKLGQAFIDLKLLVGTGFWAQKFNSEGMWFEWSELAVRAAKAAKGELEERVSNTTVSLPPQALAKARLDETWNNVASSTSKRFNGVFKSMKTSLMKPKYSEESVVEVELDYNEAYEEVQRLKHLLDLELSQKSQFLEKFEKLKIEVIYQSLTKLLEVMYKHTLKSTTSLHDFTQRFISELNKPEYYEKDLQLTLEAFNSGIYFPSIVSPKSLTQKHVNTSQLNTNFQNLKHRFNLYNDIPLQTKVCDVCETSLSTQSLPLFLWKLLPIIEGFPLDDARTAWLQPFNYQDYWLVKYEIIETIREFKATSDLQSESAVNGAIIHTVLELLSSKDLNRIVNFVKNWLLEISDSVIPSTVYDSLIANFKLKSNKTPEERASETVRILSTTPRSNLSSLIFIIEHLVKVFGLTSLERIGDTDELKSAKQESSRENLAEAAKELNLMDAIGAVPFVHLIMRPSVVKNVTGFRPPVKEYGTLLEDLLTISEREQLFAALVANEKSYIQRQEQQKRNLGLHKKKDSREASIAKQDDLEKPEVKVTPITPTKTVINSVANPRSPDPLQPPESFSLRPFRTGTTPRPSPSASPVQPLKRSVDLNVMSRSRSASLLEPNVDLKHQD